ncbi:MAG: glycosyltransferase [Armatimonadetes bacterium]|nr:MAG: glycosyltransferase [Armatimonadota bacterium]
MKKIKICGVDITTENEREILEYITKRLEHDNEKVFIITPNPEILTYASRYPEFKRILNTAQVAIPDGIGVVLASKIVARGVEKRITGVDLMEKLCFEFSKRGLTTGFFGGFDCVAERTAECLREKHPKLVVKFAGNEEDLPKLIHCDIDFLFVALGFPKQEEWIYKNLPKLKIKGAMGVGGAFDYLGGKVTRAPKMVRNLGFEWLFRLAVQPWRVKRQLALLEFMWFVIKEKLQGSKIN